MTKSFSAFVCFLTLLILDQEVETCGDPLCLGSLHVFSSAMGTSRYCGWASQRFAADVSVDNVEVPRCAEAAHVTSYGAVYFDVFCTLLVEKQPSCSTSFDSRVMTLQIAKADCRGWMSEPASNGGCTTSECTALVDSWQDSPEGFPCALESTSHSNLS